MIYALAILLRIDEESVYFLVREEDYGSFSFFKRNSVKQFATMAIREGVRRFHYEESFLTVQDERDPYGLKLHLLETRGSRHFVAMVTTREHSIPVCKKMMRELQDSFTEMYPSYPPMTGDQNLPLARAKEMLKKYQNPKDYDKIAKIQGDLDETKDILVDAIDKVLERGVKLDVLVEKSADLSEQSKLFYKTSKKFNRCCTIL